MNSCFAICFIFVPRFNPSLLPVQSFQGLLSRVQQLPRKHKGAEHISVRFSIPQRTWFSRGGVCTHLPRAKVLSWSAARPAQAVLGTRHSGSLNSIGLNAESSCFVRPSLFGGTFSFYSFLSSFLHSLPYYFSFLHIRSLSPYLSLIASLSSKKLATYYLNKKNSIHLRYWFKSFFHFLLKPPLRL